MLRRRQRSLPTSWKILQAWVARKVLSSRTERKRVSPLNMAARGLSQGTGLATMTAASAFINESATQFLTRRTCHGVARGAVAGPRPPAGAVRHVFATSVEARIRAYYEALPEASLLEPVFRAGLGDGPSSFRGPAMRSILKFSLGAGGCVVSRKDQASLGGLLLQLEASQTEQEGKLFTQEFPTEGAFVGGLRHEQHRGVSRLNWLQVPIEVSGKEYFFYHRDLFDVAVNAVRSSKKLDLFGGCSSSRLRRVGSAVFSAHLRLVSSRSSGYQGTARAARPSSLRFAPRRRSSSVVERRSLRLPYPGGLSERY